MARRYTGDLDAGRTPRSMANESENQEQSHENMIESRSLTSNRCVMVSQHRDRPDWLDAPRIHRDRACGNSCMNYTTPSMPGKT
jgi:hypothetical protein